MNDRQPIEHHTTDSRKSSFTPPLWAAWTCKLGSMNGAVRMRYLREVPGK